MCPNTLLTSAIGKPPCTNLVAHVCRRSWNFRSVMPAIFLAVAHDLLTVSVMPNTRVDGSRLGSFSSSASSRDEMARERERRVLVLSAWMLMRRAFRSTSFHLRDSISPRRMPVSRAQMTIGRSLDRFSSHASSNSNSSSRERMRVRLVSSDEEMTVSLPENGCRRIQPSRRAIESILRRTVSSLFTVAIDLCRGGACLNRTMVSSR